MPKQILFTANQADNMSPEELNKYRVPDPIDTSGHEYMRMQLQHARELKAKNYKHFKAELKFSLIGLLLGAVFPIIAIVVAIRVQTGTWENCGLGIAYAVMFFAMFLWIFVRSIAGIHKNRP